MIENVAVRHNAFHQRIRVDARPVLFGDHDAPDECAAKERKARALEEAHACAAMPRLRIAIKEDAQ